MSIDLRNWGIDFEAEEKKPVKENSIDMKETRIK